MLSPHDSRRGVAVVGSLNADRTLPVSHLPAPGETVLTSGPAQLAFGGKGANQAAAAAAFGGLVAMFGQVGDDEDGRAMLADLAGRHIDVSGVLVAAGVHSGTATIAVDGAGENLIIVDPGANGLLASADVANAPLGDAAVLLVQLEIPLAAVRAAVEAADVAGSLVVLNPAPAARVGQEILDHVHVLVPNLSELGQLTGAGPAGGIDGVARTARKLASQSDVVVTLGADGALIVPRHGGPVTHLPAPAASVVDGTGAGDCFCGCLAVLLAEGADLPDAARIAVAAATISTSARGARGRLPGRSEAEDLAAGLSSQVVLT